MRFNRSEGPQRHDETPNDRHLKAKHSFLAGEETAKVAKCIFYMMFGVWITKEDAEDLIGWRTYAAQRG